MSPFSALRHSSHSQKVTTRNLATWSTLLTQGQPARPKRFESTTPDLPEFPNGNARTGSSSRESQPVPLTITVRFVRHRAQEFPKWVIRLPLSVVWLFHAVGCWLERRMATKTAQQRGFGPIWSQTGSLHPFARNARIFSTLETATWWITQSPKTHRCSRIRSFRRLRTRRLNRRIAED
jgi:hypothetical protein